MENYVCPLCNQDVSKSIYEKITGIWKEKEKRLASLKEKEQKLIEKFDRDKQRLVANNKLEIKVQLKNQREKILEQYNDKLLKAVDLALTKERRLFESKKATLKIQFEKEAKEKFLSDIKRIKIEKDKLENSKRIQLDKYSKLNIQFKTMQLKSQKQMDEATIKIKSLEEQIKKNETPQVLGLLNETTFLEELKCTYPNDKFDHTGKGGDIVHHIIDNSNEVGKIVYELKKVAKFSSEHIIQTSEAKKLREADYGLLITNAKRNKTDIGFSTSKGIIVIHPAGAIVLITLLRDHLIKISKLTLTRKQRDETIKAVLKYIQSPSFKNSLDSIIKDTLELYDEMKKEVKTHIKDWDSRISKYRNIYAQTSCIDNKVIRLNVLENFKPKQIKGEIGSIELPNEIT